MLLSVVLFGAAAILGLLCARHSESSLLLSVLLVSLMCAGIVSGVLADMSLDLLAAGPAAVVLSLLFSGKGGGTA